MQHKARMTCECTGAYTHMRVLHIDVSEADYSGVSYTHINAALRRCTLTCASYALRRLLRKRMEQTRAMAVDTATAVAPRTEAQT
jgi:hypothetical protein